MSGTAVPKDKASTDEVLSTIADGILTVTVNRPAKRNPLSVSVLGELKRIFSDAATEPDLRLAVVTGAGDKAFASGGDLAELQSLRDTGAVKAFSEFGKSALNSIRHFPVPVIARLNGLALGGGAELAVACDLRFAAATATIGFIHARLNIAPSWGGGVDLMRLVGPGKGLRLLATEEVLSASAAQAIGLIDGIAGPNEEFDAAFAHFTAKMRAQPPQVMRAIKSLARGERHRDRARSDAEETEHFVKVWTHDDHWAAAGAILARKT